MAMLLALMLAWSAAAQSQTAAEPPRPDPLAAAQTAIEAGVTGEERLEALRRDVIAARDAASAVLEKGSVEARAARARLDALGPVPANGVAEPEDVAARRAELTAAVAAANAPLRQAEEDVRRAAVLLDEIARVLARTARDTLLSRTASPLWPATWIEAGTDLGRWRAALARQAGAAAPEAAARRRAALVPALGLVAAGLALILIGIPLFAWRLAGVLEDAPRRPGAAFLARLAELAPAVLGAMALAAAPAQFGTPLPALRTAAGLLPLIVLFPVLGWWLGRALFAPDAPSARMLPLAGPEARAAVPMAFGLGAVLGLELAAESLAKDHVFAAETVSVAAAPIILGAALLLWRLAGILRGGAKTESVSGRARGGEFVRLLTRLMQMSAILLAGAVASGYITLAREIADSAVLTVALAALALAAHRGVMAAIGAVLAGPDGERAGLGLMPVGAAVAIALLWSPMVLIAWGASGTDLAELWRRLSEGVRFGDIRLSLDGLVTLAVVLTFGLFVTRWAQKTLRVSVLPRTRLDAGAQTALLTGTGYLGTSLAALTAMSAAGLDLSNLAVIAGALSVGVGLGLQSIASNFVSGLILLVERPIREDDLIGVAGATGYVRKIAVRATRIQTFDRHDVIVPNAELISGVVRNLTLTGRYGRLIIPVGVAYGSAPDKVIARLAETARGHPCVAAEPAPFAVFVRLGDRALDFELYCHLRDIGETLTVRSDLLRAIVRAIDEAGLSIPFPQRDIRLRDAEGLAAALDRVVTGLPPR